MACPTNKKLYLTLAIYFLILKINKITLKRSRYIYVSNAPLANSFN